MRVDSDVGRTATAEPGTSDVPSEAYGLMDRLCGLEIVRVGRPNPEVSVDVDAVFGSPTLESSFKSILGMGMLILAREHGELEEGQVVVESTSGSLGVGLAVAGRMIGHPVTLVSDVNIPATSRRKLELLGANLHLVSDPHPVGGFQRARDDMLTALLEANPDWYWTRQNDSPMNPTTYRRFLLPRLAERIEQGGYAAGIFAVGSGGHFAAFSEFLNACGVPCYVADREGSVTFGGEPGASRIRGSGNQHGVPEVIARAMGRVTDVYVVAEKEAYMAVRELARQGMYVGPSSGVCWAGAGRLAEALGRGRVLTFFPDRGELYGPEVLEVSADEE